MAIPNFQAFLLPLLKLADKNAEVRLREAYTVMADEFYLTEEERSALLPSGTQTVIHNRVGWAATALKKAGLLSAVQRGVFQITPEGKRILAQNLSQIDRHYLMQFPGYMNFKNGYKIDNSSNNATDIFSTDRNETPEEILEKAHASLKEQTLGDLLDSIKNNTPSFFETLVVDTIVKMGYGGSRKEAGKAIGKSGDEGIDGIINEDRLGLDVIYLQAKRYTENSIGRPEIQKFAGALLGKRAKKGIFITTSDFTPEAKEYVKTIEAKIILISGKQLVELMWEYNIGLNLAAAYEIKKIDVDYFNEATLL